MKSFLNHIADDLYRRFGGQFEHVTVLFPNKRASLFFNQHLIDIAGKPLWAPQYMTISELFQSLSNLTVADPIQLVSMLYQAYQQTGDGTDLETLDQFWSWGELMLSDFDDIDNNLVDARRLFTNISDLDDLTHTDYLTPEQIDAIRRFFPDFHEATELKKRFLSVWKRLLPTYERFRSMLWQEHIAYEGMMKRQVAESLPTLNGQQTYVIIGFNVLNEAEHRLFRHLKENTQTLFYWDYDTMYINDEAGHFIEENIRKFGNALDGADIYDNLSKPKRIQFFASPTENAQTRHVGTILKDLPPSADTAVVLCNEALLQPMLHALPSASEVNITMGFPMTGTPVSNLLMSLMELQLRGKGGSRDIWRYSTVAPLLKHPYVCLMTDDESLQTLDTLMKHNIHFPTRSMFQHQPFLFRLFEPQQNTADLLAWLITIVEQIGRKITEAPLGTESVFNAYTMLCRLQRIHEQGLLDIQPITLQRLLLQLIKQKTIPFHGEPAVGLQVMGFLETRNLDFRNVFLLSCNEGTLPKQTHKNSFIPYNLRNAYGMTTIEQSTSLYAYHFWRLLGRAENVWIYYNNSTDGMLRGEMSRFMMQMLTSGKTSPITQYHLTSDYLPQPKRTLTVEKTPAVMEKLIARFTGTKHSLSPSAINQYLKCPLQFYLQYVAGLTNKDEMNEDVGNDVFGTIFHYCMEYIYRHRIGLNREIQAHELISMANNKAGIKRLVDEAFNVEFFKRPQSEKNRPPHYNGEQLLNREVIVSYVHDQLAYDAKLCPMTVIDVEATLQPTTLDLPTPHGHPHPTLSIPLSGIIDRIDRVTIDGRPYQRIVDYKTSSTSEKANDIESLFDPTKKDRAGYILQAFYYAYIYTLQHPHSPVAPSIMYIKQARSTDPQNLKNSVISLGTDAKREPVTDFAAQWRDVFRDRLTDTLAEIFDPAVPFTQDSTEQSCKWCKFTRLCGWQSKDD